MLEKEIRAYALKNSIEHGSAVAAKVLPKLFNHGLKKEGIKKIMPEINKAIKEINSLPEEERERQFRELKHLIPEKREEKHELSELKNTENLVMRFEPSPSGPLHIGHAYVLSLNNEYVKKYNGKLILRIGDTNPENIYAPAYEMIPEDANWLTGNNVYKTIVQSDRMKIYYEFLEKLLELDKIYICTCDSEEHKKLISKSKACACRDIPKEKQKERWKKMFSEYKQGEAVTRLKTNLSDKNPAMRDFPLARINETEHPRQEKKFRVWPLMNLAVACDDIEMKITHVIRAKDHADNAKRQEIIYSYLNHKPPQALFVGRINFEDMPLSTTETKQAIKEKKYSGWDDIRLPFIPALKRRGYQPEALTKYSMEIGVTLTDKTVPKDEFFKAINHFNKEIIDKKANRYFFVQKPKKIKIKHAHPEIEVKIPLHPDDARGFRKFRAKDEFYIEDKLGKDKPYRLMHLFNFKNKEFISREIEPELNAKLIHWLPVSKELVKTKVLMENGKYVEGLAEPDAKNIKEGEIIQFERFGFVKLDKKAKSGLEFWWLHK